MTDRPGFDGLEQLEAELRDALSREADAVRPDDRLGEIRAAVSPTRRRRGSWWAPIAAAAAVAAIVVGAWIGLRPSAAPPIPATPSTTVPVSPAPSTARVPRPLPPTTAPYRAHYCAVHEWHRLTVRHVDARADRRGGPPGLLPGPTEHSGQALRAGPRLRPRQLRPGDRRPEGRRGPGRSRDGAGRQPEPVRGRLAGRDHRAVRRAPRAGRRLAQRAGRQRADRGGSAARGPGPGLDRHGRRPAGHRSGGGHRGGGGRSSRRSVRTPSSGPLPSGSSRSSPRSGSTARTRGRPSRRARPSSSPDRRASSRRTSSGSSARAVPW